MRHFKIPPWLILFLVGFVVHLSSINLAAAPDDSTKRTAFLDQLRGILEPSAAWDEWLLESGELPPNFDKMPSIPFLPEPLIHKTDGTRDIITTHEEWRNRREVVLEEFKHWIIGTYPPPPDTFEVEILGKQRENQVKTSQIRLHFGPGNKANLSLEIFLPEGEGPFPVFMTQANHRGWAMIAVRRGYLACVYAGADNYDDTNSFKKAYPGYDWSNLTRRAWAASRCLDYLETIPQADMEKVVIAGHSRNGKQALIASAIDERFSAVISSSAGVGGTLSARLCSEQHFNSGIEILTNRYPDWFHPRLRFFIGREDKLPVDFNQLVAMSAPRPCLLSIALNDNVENTWAMQQTYSTVKDVYEIYQAGDKLDILWRHGGHESWPTVIDKYLDWSDAQFNNMDDHIEERYVWPSFWNDWKNDQASLNEYDLLSRKNKKLLRDNKGKKIKSKDHWIDFKSTIQEDIEWMLGDAPPGVKDIGTDYGKDPSHIHELLKRGGKGSGLQKVDLVFGEYINADVYIPQGGADTDQKFPAILWLHPFNPSTGYSAGYRRGKQAYNKLAEAGFAVFAYDQVGFGWRVEEAESFYDYHPDWSLMGKMVRDAKSALNRIWTMKYVDKEQVWVVGYGLGSMVGMHLCATDRRPAGMVAVSAPPPYETNRYSPEKSGVDYWSKDTMLIPKLGLYSGQEEKVPYDLQHLVSMIAPRPVLVINPKLNWETDLDEMVDVLMDAKDVYKLYDAGDKLELLVPDYYNCFDTKMQILVIDWIQNYLQ